MIVKKIKKLRTNIILLFLYFFGSKYECFSNNIVYSDKEGVIISGERQVKEAFDRENNLIILKVEHPYNMENVNPNLMESLAKNKFLHRDLFVYNLANLGNKSLEFRGNSTKLIGKSIFVSHLDDNKAYIDIYPENPNYRTILSSKFLASDEYPKNIEIVKIINTGIFISLEEIKFTENNGGYFIRNKLSEKGLINLHIQKGIFANNSKNIFDFYQPYSIEIENSLFQKNEHFISIQEYSNRISLTKITFENNELSNTKNNVVNLKYIDSFFMEDSSFINNNFSLYIKNDSVYNLDCKINHNKFQNNNSLYSTGGLLNFDVYYTNYSIENSLFENNKAKYGGAINSYSPRRGVKCIMNNLIIINNKADEAGGIYLKEKYSHPNHNDFNDYKITNTILSNNKASNNGGGFYLDNSNIKISNSVLLNNKARNGAALHLTNKSHVLLTNYVNISKNETTSNEHSASIFIDNTSLMEFLISDSNIILYDNRNKNNESVDVLNDGTLIVRHRTIEYNPYNRLHIYGGIKGDGQFIATGSVMIDIHKSIIKNKNLQFNNYNGYIPFISLDILDFNDENENCLGGKITADYIRSDGLFLHPRFLKKDDILNAAISGNQKDFYYTFITANKENNLTIYLEDKYRFIENLNAEIRIIKDVKNIKIKLSLLGQVRNPNKEFLSKELDRYNFNDFYNNFDIEEAMENDYDFEPAIFDYNNIRYNSMP